MPDRPIRQPSRVIVGHCPDCERVVVVENEHEVWAYVQCTCGWGGATDAIKNRVRFERGGVRTDGHAAVPQHPARAADER